jgi:methylase of polypeptide subunit release factors
MVDSSPQIVKDILQSSCHVHIVNNNGSATPWRKARADARLAGTSLAPVAVTSRPTMRVRAGAGEREYLLTQMVRTAARVARGTVRRAIRRRPDRHPAAVRNLYDAHRAGFPIDDFDSYVYGDAETPTHVLVDDRIVWRPAAPIAQRFLVHLGDVIQAHTGGNGTVVELGSGRGRNLLYLKRRFPDLRCVGLDISPVSTALARAAAERFGLAIEVANADVTQPLPPLPSDIAVCYSVHALEQMPRIFPQAVQAMLGLQPRAVALFEPVAELYPPTLRGWVSRLYIRDHDYLNGLYRHVQGIGATITRAARLGYATNPLNETAEILLVPKSVARGRPPTE